MFGKPVLENLSSEYLRLDTSNDPLTGELVTQRVVPDGDQVAGYTFGSDTARPLSVHGRLGVFVGSSSGAGQGAPVNASGTRSFGNNPTGIMGGNQAEGGTGVSTHYLRGGAFKGVACIGNAVAGAAGNATLRNNSGGGSVFGSAYTYGGGAAIVEARNFGNFTTAYAYVGGANQHSFLNDGTGAFLSGYSQGQGTVTVNAYGSGSFCAVRPRAVSPSAVATARAYGGGSFCAGFLLANGIGAPTVLLDAVGYGSFVQGEVSQAGAGTSSIIATGVGAFAQGFATASSVMTASANGAFAQGQARGGNNITASGIGSFAHGDSNGGPITASALNSGQFGVGANALADSLQIGNGGIRFKGTVGAPGVPQNGDFWVAGGYVYVQTNGAAVQIVGPGPLTN